MTGSYSLGPLGTLAAASSREFSFSGAAWFARSDSFCFITNDVCWMSVNRKKERVSRHGRPFSLPLSFSLQTKKNPCSEWKIFLVAGPVFLSPPFEIISLLSRLALSPFSFLAENRDILFLLPTVLWALLITVGGVLSICDFYCLSRACLQGAGEKRSIFGKASRTHN